MEAVSQYAGFLAAHDIERASQNDPIVPMLAFQRSDGTREVIKLPEPLKEGLAQGSQWLNRNPEDAALAVLVFQGSVVIDELDTDAIVCKAVQYQPEKITYKVAIPFQRGTDGEFTVYRIKILDFEGDDPDYDALVSAFFRGVENNEKGADIWYKHLDQSK